MPCGQFKDAISLLRSRYGRQLLSEAEFDAEYYLDTYPDVVVAVEQGILASAYAHYYSYGYREGRLGRSDDVFEPHNEQVWANLIHTLGDLRTAVTHQAGQLEALKARRASRLKLRDTG
jgi:hypothetical protein